MAEKTTGATDLFGDPWTPPRDPRGRKRHRRMAEVAEKIAVLRATGATVEQVSLRIGLSEPTLRKYYFRELDQGDDLVESVLNEAMWAKAMGGNVSAAKFVREQMQKGKAAAALQRRGREATPAAPTAAKLGKKEERQEAARAVGGKYAPPEAPRPIVDNG